MFERPTPRLKAVQHQAVREKVDDRFVTLVRELEDCYYGTALAWDVEGHATARATDGWRHGISHPFDAGAGRRYDVQSTPDGSKALFDRLHAAIWHLHAIALSDRNAAEGHRYPDLDRPDEDGLSLKGRAQAALAALGEEGVAVAPERVASRPRS